VGDLNKKTSARPFNPHLCAGSQQLHTALEEILKQLKGYEGFYKLRKRKRRAVDQATFERTVEALVCDLVLRESEVPGGGVHLPLSNKVLRKKSRYKGVALNKTLPEVLRIMAADEMSFVEVEKGRMSFKVINQNLDLIPVSGEQTVVRADSKLLTRIKKYHLGPKDVREAPDEEIIVLRGKKPRSDKPAPTLEYADTPETLELRSSLQAINAYLSGANIECDLAGTNDQKRRLRRIFHNGSFQHGGRLYGGFWQEMGSDNRHMHVLIDGDETAELDVGQTGIFALYKLAGATPPKGDLYDLSSAGIPTTARDGIKKVMNAMVSASEPLARLPKGARKSLPRKYSLRQVTEAINKVHPNLAGNWCNGLYGAVWRIESDALVEVLTRLNSEGIVALPIHDAVLVADKHKDRALEVMLEVYEKALGVKPKVTVT
jgi:hypothetical protein